MSVKVCCLILVISSSAVFGQADFNRRYQNAKEHFIAGRYNLAMESFKQLIPYDQRNPYSEYASFYYALAAYRQNYRAVARDMLNQIRSLYPKWEKIDEVNFWLAKIHFDNGDYFQGLKIFSQLDSRKFGRDIEVAKAALFAITDAETLRMMLEEYPDDKVIAMALASLLSKELSGAGTQAELEELIRKYNFRRSDYLPEAPKTFHKDRYAVSVLLPFMVDLLDPTPSKKRNQIVLDFYEGMKLAADTLRTLGVDISLRAYDTERSMEKTRRILNTTELKNTDLIVGPFFPEENRIVQEFSLANKINIVHPFSNSSDIIGANPHAFLFQPSAETLGRKAAEYIAPRVSRKNCIVFYGPNKKDSVLASNFVTTATEKGLNIVLSERVSAREAGRILEILATPTEFDEFKYPSQFTLKKDSIGSIYVASDDALIYSKVITTVETRADSIKVVGSENWLDDSAVDPEKYQTLRVTLTAPNYADASRPQFQAFFRSFMRRYGRTPSTSAKMGFEFLMFFGNQLKKNGVYFQDGLAKAGVVPGYLYQGFNYQYTRDNALIPFITVQDGELSILDKL